MADETILKCHGNKYIRRQCPCPGRHAEMNTQEQPRVACLWQETEVSCPPGRQNLEWFQRLLCFPILDSAAIRLGTGVQYRQKQEWLPGPMG